MMWLNMKRSHLRDWLLKDRTWVTRMRLDDLMEEPAFSSLNPYPSTVGALLDVSRSLRLVALRFAVNPVYAALIQKAGGSSFSPINTLVYFAQILEETASFPYWQSSPRIAGSGRDFPLQQRRSASWPRQVRPAICRVEMPEQAARSRAETSWTTRIFVWPRNAQQQAAGPAVRRAGPAGVASKRDAGGPLDDGTVRLWRFSHGRVVLGFHR
jgi:hypothetical protein